MSNTFSSLPIPRLSDDLALAMSRTARYRRLFLLDAIGKEATRALVEVKERRLQSEAPNLCAKLTELDRFEFAVLLAFLEVKTGRLWK